MSIETETLAIIPARAHSSRMPGKNTAPFYGRGTLPLAAVRCALNAGLTRVVLATDDHANGLAVSSNLSMAGSPIAVHLRPPSSDTEPIEDVISMVLEEEDPPPEWVMLLNPTSPFRTPDLLRECLRYAATGRYDGVYTATPISAPLVWRHDGRWIPPERGQHSRSQDRAILYVEHGACYLVRSRIVRQGTLYTQNAMVVLTGRLPAIDIDTRDDWEHAELVARGMD